MKFVKIIPRRLFRQRKSCSVARSEADPLSIGSSLTSSSLEDGSKKHNGSSTPTSVLPAGEWSDASFELKRVFEMIDGDGDGKIPREELEALLCRLGAEPPCREELRLILGQVDADGDGSITLEEFHSIGSAFAPPTCDAEVRQTFGFFDSDGDGRITAEELFSVFRTIGGTRCTLEDCRRMISGVDSTGGGSVCLEDFSRMMDHRRQQ